MTIRDRIKRARARAQTRWGQTDYGTFEEYLDWALEEEFSQTDTNSAESESGKEEKAG